MSSSPSTGSLLARLLELPEGERARFLQQAAKQEPDLPRRWREIEAILRQARQDGPITPHAATVVDELEAALTSVDPDGVGSQIGPYKLLQRIGEGGFGVVWMAEQSQPMQRRVAIKIVKAGMDTGEVIARFEAERQALALMDHPNIARVLDGGATATGRPYFVMELVRGTAITRYCDENRVPPDERLRLFIAVCQGVQHAHQKGVIHRDLKPSNILITLHDGVPVPKIIDFGIAKATTGLRLTPKTLFTQFHAFVGTPVYTSPEQMEMSGLDVDTRSDIYSLGVLLYELLAGRPPFDAEALAQSGLEAMRRTIRDVEPPRPSLRLATLPVADRTEVAHRRSVDPSKLVASLHGDLDWIVMHCLEKDRTRRYDTAAAVAADIERHLEHRPVEAHAPSPVYRARKFIRRHRVGVAAVGAVFVSLVAGLVASSVLFMRERVAVARATTSERAEVALRKQAERAREMESIRASQLARDVAEEQFAKGRSAEGIAWLVHAARTNRREATIGSRLVSALAARRFLVPTGPPLRFSSRITNLHYFDAGRKIGVYCEDGAVGAIDTSTGTVVQSRLPSRIATPGALFAGRYAIVRGEDEIVRLIDGGTARVETELNFGQKIARISVRGAEAPRVFVGLDDDSFVVADTMLGQIRRLPITFRPTTRAVLSDDGRWLGVMDRDSGSTEVWDTTTGERHGGPTALGAVLSVGFSPDGQRVVVVNGTPARVNVTVRSIPDLTVMVPPTELRIEHFAGSAVIAISFSPDSRYFCVASQFGSQVYELATGNAIGPLLPTGITARVTPAEISRTVAGIGLRTAFQSVLFRFKGDQLLTIAPTPLDSVVRLEVRDAVSGQPVLPPLAFDDSIGAARLSEDGSTLLTFAPSAVLLWNMDTGQLRAEPHAIPPSLDFDLALAPDGHELAIGCADGSVQRLRIGGAPAASLTLPRTSPFMPTAFFPSAPARLFWPKSDCAAALDIASGVLSQLGSYPERIVGFSRNQLGMAIREDVRFMVVRTDAGAWQSWTINHDGVRRVATLENTPATNAAWPFFSPNSDHVAIAANDPGLSIGVWSLVTGRSLGAHIVDESLVAIGDQRRPACFSPDGRLLLGGTIDGSVNVWEWETGRRVAGLPSDQPGTLLYVGASQDGTRIVTSNARGETRLWDAATLRRVGDSLHGRWAAFSRSSERVLVLHNDGARVWDARTATALSAPMLHRGVGIRTAAFSADGHCVVTAAQDSTARIWDAATGRPLSDPLRHDSRVVGCEFSPDRRFVRTEEAGHMGSQTGFRVWSVPPDVHDQPTPEWLLDLATIFAGRKIDASGQCVDAPEALARIDEIRRTVAALPDDASFAPWGQWLLDDRPDRSIAPGFTVTRSGAERLATELMP